MSRFRLWVRISQAQTAFTVICADNVLMAKMLGEAQYGAGNVLGCTQID